MQQIEMLLLGYRFSIAPGEDGESHLKFLGRYHRLPVAAQRLGWNMRPLILRDHPTSIKPVVENPRERLFVGDSLPLLVNTHKRTTIAQAVATREQSLANILQRWRILQQQVPGIAPDLRLLRVDFDPTLVTRMLHLLFSP
ncbi:MAG: hypothetical protein DWB42_20675 [Chloroflexi bacterium]|nr:hypothetical protein [Chloroflexota bacterium]